MNNSYYLSTSFYLFSIHSASLSLLSSVFFDRHLVNIIVGRNRDYNYCSSTVNDARFFDQTKKASTHFVIRFEKAVFMQLQINYLKMAAPEEWGRRGLTGIQRSNNNSIQIRFLLCFILFLFFSLFRSLSLSFTLSLSLSQKINLLR